MADSAAGLAHLVGDYVVQSDWMAARKTSEHLPAVAHAATYTACFLPITRNPRALAVIGVTHFVIDRWRLARHVVWAKNQLAPPLFRHPWDGHVSATGYHDIAAREVHGYDPPSDACDAQAKPTWMSVPLMIVADNTLHLLINRWALRRWR